MAAARITETIVDNGGRASGVVVDDGVPMAETTVDARDAARSVVESAAMERTGVKPAAMDSTMEPPAVEPAAMAAPTVSPSKGEVWLAECSDTQHGGCGSSQSPSYPGPGSIFAEMLH
jgi:hypothetical protein